MFDLQYCRGISAVTSKMVRTALVLHGVEKTRKLLTTLAEMEVDRKVCIAARTNEEEAEFLQWASKVRNK